MSINQSTTLFKCLIFYLRRCSLMKLSSHFLHHPRSARTLALEASSQGEVVTRKFGSLNSGDPLIVIDGLYIFCLLMDSIFAKFLTLIIFIMCRFLFIPCKLCGKLAVFSLFTSSNKVLLTYSCTKRNILQNRILENAAFERCRRWWSSSKASILRAYERRECLAWVFSLDLGTFDSTKLPRSS